MTRTRQGGPVSPRSTQGFSLAELLVTIVIILLLSIVVATGVPAAVRTYRGVVTSSNAHILLGTASVRLRDELSVADPATVQADDASVTFTSLEDGFKTTLAFDDLQLSRSPLQPGSTTVISSAPLVPATYLPEGAYADLRVTCEGISYRESDGCFVVSHLRVVRADAGEHAVAVSGAEFDEVRIRPLAEA